eukprot:4961431-Pyramimonas_sp.AAC.1
MSFVLPSSFKDARAAPSPTNGDVSVANAHWGAVACLTFSGIATRTARENFIPKCTSIEIRPAPGEV